MEARSGPAWPCGGSEEPLPQERGLAPPGKALSASHVGRRVSREAHHQPTPPVWPAKGQV